MDLIQAASIVTEQLDLLEVKWTQKESKASDSNSVYIKTKRCGGLQFRVSDHQPRNRARCVEIKTKMSPGSITILVRKKVEERGN